MARRRFISNQIKTQTMTILRVPVTQETRNIKIWHAISSIMAASLSEKEIQLLDLLYRKGGILTTQVRKEIREELKMSSEFMNNYVMRIRNKKIIVGEDPIQLNRMLREIQLPQDGEDYKVVFQFLHKAKQPIHEEHVSSDTGGSAADGA
jgi:hypothetical protein